MSAALAPAIRAESLRVLPSGYEACAAACAESRERHTQEHARRLTGTTGSLWSPTRQFALPHEALDFPKAFELVPTVNFCVTLISEMLAAVPFRFYREDGRRQKVEIERRPGDPRNPAELFAVANTEQSGYELRRDLYASLLIQGNAYLERDRTALGEQLWILNPLTVAPIPMDGKPRITGFYEVGHGRDKRRVDREDMVHFRLYHPGHGLIGLSPLQALMLSYETERDQGRFLRALNSRGGQVAGVYSTEMGLDPDARKEIQEDLRRQLSPENAGNPVLVTRALKYERSGLTLKEMAYLETSGLTHEQILRGYKIHPMIAGAATGTGLNSDVANVVQRMLIEQALAPLATLVQETANEKMLASGEFGRGVTCAHDFSKTIPMRKVWLEVGEAMTKLTGAPIMTRNEGRAQVDLEEADAPEADELLIPGNVSTDAAKAEAAEAQAKAAMEAAKQPKVGPAESPARSAPDHARDAAPTSRELGRESLRVMADRTLRIHERRMERGFRRLFTQQEARVIEKLRGQNRTILPRDGHLLAAVRAIDVAELLQDDDSDRSLVMELIRAVVEDQGEQAIADLGLDLAFDVAKRDIAEWIEERAARNVRHINETTRERLRAEIAESEDARESLGELIARVERVFEGRRANASVIARSEVTPAYSYATIEAWQQSGVVEGKEWLSANDDAVRDAHRELDGQVVPLGGMFRVDGAEAPHPGAFGVAELDIQCRCTLVASLMPSYEATGGEAALPRVIAERMQFRAGAREAARSSDPAPRDHAGTSGLANGAELHQPARNGSRPGTAAEAHNLGVGGSTPPPASTNGHLPGTLAEFLAGAK